MTSDRILRRLDDLHLEQFPDSELAMKIRMRRMNESARSFALRASSAAASLEEAAAALRRLVDGTVALTGKDIRRATDAE